MELTISFFVYRISVLLSDGHQLGLGYESGIQLGGLWDKLRVKKYFFSWIGFVNERKLVNQLAKWGN